MTGERSFWAVYRQSDMTEGRGPMVVVSYHATEQEAWDTINTTGGVMGSKPPHAYPCMTIPKAERPATWQEYKAKFGRAGDYDVREVPYVNPQWRSAARAVADPGGKRAVNEELRARTRRNMERLGIPKGTDNRKLLALGAAKLEPTYAEQVAHLNEGSCGCHDSWDQCPCAEAGHSPGCECCPLGTGLCGPKSELELLRDLAAECWAHDTDDSPFPGRIPELLDALASKVDWLRAGTETTT